MRFRIQPFVLRHLLQKVIDALLKILIVSWLLVIREQTDEDGVAFSVKFLHESSLVIDLRKELSVVYHVEVALDLLRADLRLLPERDDLMLLGKPFGVGCALLLELLEKSLRGNLTNLEHEVLNVLGVALASLKKTSLLPQLQRVLVEGLSYLLVELALRLLGVVEDQVGLVLFFETELVADHQCIKDFIGLGAHEG